MSSSARPPPSSSSQSSRASGLMSQEDSPIGSGIERRLEALELAVELAGPPGTDVGLEHEAHPGRGLARARRSTA